MPVKQEFAVGTCGNSPVMGKLCPIVVCSKVCSTRDEVEEVMERFPRDTDKFIVTRFDGSDWELLGVRSCD